MMKYRTLGQTGWKVSTLGFRAWAIGGDAWGQGVLRRGAELR